MGLNKVIMVYVHQLNYIFYVGVSHCNYTHLKLTWRSFQNTARNTVWVKIIAFEVFKIEHKKQKKQENIKKSTKY